MGATQRARKPSLRPRSPLVLAEDAVRLVEAEPARARRQASAALTKARARGEAEAAAVALRALGLAARELGELHESSALLQQAIAEAERAELHARSAEARMSLALTLVYRGRTVAGLREADRAAAALRGPARAELLMQRSLLLQRLGRLNESLDGYGRALPIVRRAADRFLEARLLLNRGVLQTYRGVLGAAEADLRRCAEIAEELDQGVLAAKARHNLGFVAARRGDVPQALALYDGVEAEYRRLGLPCGMLQLDRCEVLLSVHLAPEARRAAADAAAELDRAGAATDHAEALLLLSQAALLDGDADAAHAAAAEARRSFTKQRRPGWGAVAQLAEVRALWQSGDRTLETLAAARRTRRALGSIGLPAPELEAGLIAARVALETGHSKVARRELVPASRLRRSGSAGLRASAWHAEALLRLARGDRRGGTAALRAGLRVLEISRAALGASELRAHASAGGAELARLGLGLALADGRAESVLAWAERWRAGGLGERPVALPADDRLVRELAELRRVVGELEAAALENRDTVPLLRQQAALEERIRRRARHAPGSEPPARSGAPSIDALAAALGERALVELVEHERRLSAVTLVDGRARLWPLGPTDAPSFELDALRFALRRLAFGRGRGPAKAAALAAARRGFTRLDELLLEPLRRDVGDRPLVLVPTGKLHALPWAGLPSAAGCPVTVSPSATLWLRGEARSHPDGGGVVLVAGPGLPGAADEVGSLARRYRRRRVLADRRATAAATLSALDGAHLAHLAAHGRFRADNPHFSDLQLADGPLTVYDLERLDHPPVYLVLSACESGLSAVRPGDELMGLVAALLSLGTRAIVASVAPVADLATVPVMLELHERLRAGAAPAEALAALRTESDREVVTAASSFVCFGAG